MFSANPATAHGVKPTPRLDYHPGTRAGPPRLPPLGWTAQEERERERVLIRLGLGGQEIQLCWMGIRPLPGKVATAWPWLVLASIPQWIAMPLGAGGRQGEPASCVHFREPFREHFRGRVRGSNFAFACSVSL